MDNDELREITEDYLRDWPLYSGWHSVSVRDIGNGVWIGYRTSPSNQKTNTTHFDVNIIAGIFYILSIGVAPEHRGKGHGSALYEILEGIAEEVGCKRIQTTPSGWTQTGETRKGYLLRRGYTDCGTEVVKEIK